MYTKADAQKVEVIAMDAEEIFALANMVFVLAKGANASELVTRDCKQPVDTAEPVS